MQPYSGMDAVTVSSTIINTIIINICICTQPPSLLFSLTMLIFQGALDYMSFSTALYGESDL